MSEANRKECTLHPFVLRVRRELTKMARSHGYHPEYRQGCWVGRCLLNDALKTWSKQNAEAVRTAVAGTLDGVVGES